MPHLRGVGGRTELRVRCPFSPSYAKHLVSEAITFPIAGLDRPELAASYKNAQVNFLSLSVRKYQLVFPESARRKGGSSRRPCSLAP